MPPWVTLVTAAPTKTELRQFPDFDSGAITVYERLVRRWGSFGRRSIDTFSTSCSPRGRYEPRDIKGGEHVKQASKRPTRRQNNPGLIPTHCCCGHTERNGNLLLRQSSLFPRCQEIVHAANLHYV